MGDRQCQLKETCEDVVAGSVRLMGVQTLQILIMLLFLIKLSVRTGLVNLARNERKNM